MDAEGLRTLQQPLKQAYRDDPERAVVTLRASGVAGEGLTCSVTTGRAMVEAGLHPATGGDGTQLCSGDLLLEAEADLDFRGTLGVSADAPVGFREVRLRFELGTDADSAAVDKLVELTERYCVVLQTIRAVTPIASSWR